MIQRGFHGSPMTYLPWNQCLRIELSLSLSGASHPQEESNDAAELAWDVHGVACKALVGAVDNFLM